MHLFLETFDALVAHVQATADDSVGREVCWAEPLRLLLETLDPALRDMTQRSTLGVGSGAQAWEELEGFGVEARHQHEAVSDAPQPHLLTRAEVVLVCGEEELTPDSGHLPLGGQIEHGAKG